MPYCPKCYSSNVEKTSSKAGGLVMRLAFIAATIAMGGSQSTAQNFIGSDPNSYRCKNCGHKWDEN